MAKTMVNEFVIPRCEGRAFEVLKDQVLRVIAIEGKQVGDMTVLNLHDFRETFSAQCTNSSNGRYLTKAEKLYSRPPAFNEMLSVVDDKVGVHWIHGRCTSLMYRLINGIEGHPNCPVDPVS